MIYLIMTEMDRFNAAMDIAKERGYVIGEVMNMLGIFCIESDEVPQLHDVLGVMSICENGEMVAFPSEG